MRFYRCDRCGREYTVNRHGINEGALGLRNPTETCLTIDLPTDLCDDCRKDFEAWFRQPKMDKAMEEARAKQHAHENNDVTVLRLPDGSYVCPVCGESMSFPANNCPRCKVKFNAQVNYIKMNKKENKDNEQQSDAEKT